MFLGKQRPSGLEFAACEPCNNGTKGADIVASFFARISADDSANSEKLSSELRKLIHALDTDAPGVRKEVLNNSAINSRWYRGPSGFIAPKIEVRTESKLLRSYLAVFAAKMGMALYREYVGVPLPLHGAVFVKYFLNAGLSEQRAQTYLKILPGHQTLKQGKIEVNGQFTFRYNTDENSICAAFVGFHKNLHIFLSLHQPQIYIYLYLMILEMARSFAQASWYRHWRPERTDDRSTGQSTPTCPFVASRSNQTRHGPPSATLILAASASPGRQDSG